MRTASAYSLECQARVMAPFYHPSNEAADSHRFLVGTSCFFGDNKIYLLEYQEETKVLECSTVWFNEAEVFGLWSSPSLKKCSLFAVSSPSATRVLQVPETLSGELQEVACFGFLSSQVLWALDGQQDEVTLTTGNSLRVCSLASDCARDESPLFQIVLDTQINCAALDTHRSSVCVVACENIGLYLIDTRKEKADLLANTAALHGIGSTRCIDFSCTKMNLFLTCGDDGYLRWHDMRMTGAACPVVESRNYLRAHSHAVQKALLNPFHHELLVSCGSDHTLKLWSTSSGGARVEQAVCLNKLTDFGDSVTDVCWSSSTPWVFAGVSYNGNVLVSDVPKEKKLEILLKDT